METLVGSQVPGVQARLSLPEAEQAFIVSNVKVCTSPVHKVRENNHTGPIDGWMCAAAVTTDRPCGPFSVFSQLPALLCTRIFEDRCLKADEEQLLASMTMKHADAHEVRSVNRQFHHRWLGIEGTPLAGAVDRAHPCHPWILEATGEAADSQDTGSACSSKRFCISCEKLFETTAVIPPFAAVLPSVVAVLEVALQEWCNATSGSWCTRDLNSAPHMCDASCPQNPEAGR